MLPKSCGHKKYKRHRRHVSMWRIYMASRQILPEIRFIWMIYFLFTITLPVRGPVAERALFKRVKKHKKIKRHKRHVKMWTISCRQMFYFRHLFLDQPIFRRKCSFYFEKDDFLMKRMFFYKKGDFFLTQTKKIVDNQPGNLDIAERNTHWKAMNRKKITQKTGMKIQNGTRNRHPSGCRWNEPYAICGFWINSLMMDRTSEPGPFFSS